MHGPQANSFKIIFIINTPFWKKEPKHETTKPALETEMDHSIHTMILQNTVKGIPGL